MRDRTPGGDDRQSLALDRFERVSRTEPTHQRYAWVTYGPYRRPRRVLADSLAASCAFVAVLLVGVLCLM